MNSDNTQSHSVTDELTRCSRCAALGTLRSFTTWHDAVTGEELRHCDACAALTTCGVCRTEGNAKDYRTILDAGEFVMDVCGVCDSGVSAAHV
jgi:hypothetical protein